MEWIYDDLQNWIKNGCDKEIAKNVVKLDISSNGLGEIPIEQLFNCPISDGLKEIPKEIGQLINLQIFNCNNNEIKKIPKEIGQLINLQEFQCWKNQIDVIPKEIGQLINLQKFYFWKNQIEEIPKEIGQLTNLQEFSCKYNKIKEIPKEICQLINLQYISCGYNQIKEIPKEIGLLHNLRVLSCYVNQIKEIPKEIGELTNLQHFYLDYNQIKEIPIEIIRCRNLTHLAYLNNEIEYIPPQVVRFLNRYGNHNVQKIYNDTQSVHNHNIQVGIQNSIIYLMKNKPDLDLDKVKNSILDNEILTEQTKRLLFDYMGDKTVHSVLNITFEELLISVFNFILKNENKDEIFKILNKEITDSLCMCFTGRISRLVNSLNGFDDNIVINISDSEQIGNIIILIKQKLENEGRFTDELFKETIRKELKERQYEDNVINEWIENI